MTIFRPHSLFVIVSSLAIGACSTKNASDEVKAPETQGNQPSKSADNESKESDTSAESPSEKTVNRCQAKASPETKQPFQFSVKRVKREHSKDSNSQSVTATLSHDTLSYKGPAKPCKRGRCRRATVDMTLTEAEIDELKALTSELNLWQDIEENVTQDGNGPSKSTSIKVTLEDNHQKNTAQVYFKSVYKSSEPDKALSQAGQTYQSNTSAFIRKLRLLARECAPEAL